MSEAAISTATAWPRGGSRGLALLCSVLLHLLLIAPLLWHRQPTQRPIATAPQRVSVMLLGASVPAAASRPPSAPAMPRPATKPQARSKPLTEAVADPAPSATAGAGSASRSTAAPAASTPDDALATPPPIEYLRRIARIVSLSQKYPWSARQYGQQGDVLVRIHLQRDGRVLAIALMQSSGVAALDAEACDVMRRIARFPPFPADYLPSIGEFDIDQPVNFRHYLN